ncbi:MAG: penicillin-binding protein 2 [Candidatus Omnitrophica bacterium]|nr:penicillin-binding protein 2 [Candidatus Omnitrophota bacterium]MBU1783791.1 penicillin-binding protein 2 [Candidatus Omnitrophota bacterium]
MYLQIFNHEKFKEMAEEQHNTVYRIEPLRGMICDRFGEPLAINLDTPSICANPRSIDDKENTAHQLSRALDVDEEVLLERLRRDKAFVWVKRRVAPPIAAKVKGLELPGIYLTNESKRYYPNDAMAAHIVGFAGLDNAGLEGIELFYDSKLRGKPGLRYVVRDARLKPILFDEKSSVPAQNGFNVVLTIDSVIQYIVEKELDAMVKKFKAKGASIIVMEPSTGKILAMASYPGYDLNDSANVRAAAKKNTAIASVFEPGSVFKIITASAALNEGICSLDEKFDCENGSYSIGGRILSDYHPYGELTFDKVISKSSNIGTVKIARKLGKKKFCEYIERFGFGKINGIDLAGEVPGIYRSPDGWTPSDMTTIPIGQGIAVTPLQLVCAVSAIAAGGNLMKPYIVDRVTTWEGGVVRSNHPLVRRRVLTNETCREMRSILADVVETGTGRRARSKIYVMCGKTGTAQMVNSEGGYYKNKYDATFIGFAPKEDARISMIVTARDPHPSHFGGTVAGPTFKNIAEKTLEYLESNSND